MELFTLEDFKNKKLDLIQKKTEKEKSTALVVCIDHGMCAAFYLPKDSLNDECNGSVENEPGQEFIAKPDMTNTARRYLSVKKSLDKVFPSSIAKPDDAENQAGELRFLNLNTQPHPPSIACSNYSQFAADITEEEEAVRNIPQSPPNSDSE